MGQPSGPGSFTKLSGAAGYSTSSACHYDLSTTDLFATSFVEVTVFVLSDQYVGPKDFAKQALASSAGSSQATVEEVAGVGDYAGVEIPPTPALTVTSDFFAQKGSVVVKVGFQGTKTSIWPTAAQLTRVGKVVAAKVF